MHIENIKKIRSQFGPYLHSDLTVDLSDTRYDWLWQMLSDVQNFMSKSPEYQLVITNLHENIDGVFVGTNLKTQGRKREKGHEEWLMRRLLDIFEQYKWDSNYETVV